MRKTNNPNIGYHRTLSGLQTRERVREYLLSHPGIYQHEIAKALNLSTTTVNRHIKALRAEWKEPKCSDSELPTTAASAAATTGSPQTSSERDPTATPTLPTTRKINTH